MNTLTRLVSRSFHTVPFPDQALANSFTRFWGPEGINRDATLEHPETVARYWQVARTMQNMGLIPFVHGQASSWSISQQVLAALGHTSCRMLRADDEVALKKACGIQDQVQTIVKAAKFDPRRWLLPKFVSKEGRLDHDPVLRTHLLAVTIGLFHCEYHESPLTFVFNAAAHKYDLNLKGNISVLHEATTRKLQNSLIKDAMQNKCYDSSLIDHYIARIQPLYDQAQALCSGQLLVIGVPYELTEKLTYHCRPFGYPTGLSMQAVIDKICKAKVAKELPNQGCQARFIFCKESMDPSSGVCVVNIMDKKASNAFIEGMNVPAIWDEPQTKEFLKSRTTPIELSEQRERDDFQLALDAIVGELTALKI